MLVSMLPTTAWAVDEETTTPTTVNVDFSFAKGNEFEVVPHTLTVAAGNCGSYGVGEPTTELRCWTRGCCSRGKVWR